MNSGTYLLDEKPLTVYRSLAVILGSVDKALILTELHWLLNNKRQSRDAYSFVDGRWWVYNSYPQWRDHFFPWLSIPTLQRYFAELEDLKIIVTKQGVKNPMDRKKWYSIDYVEWEFFVEQAELGSYATKNGWSVTPTESGAEPAGDEARESDDASSQNDMIDHRSLIRSTVAKSDDDSSVLSLPVLSLQDKSVAPVKPDADRELTEQQKMFKLLCEVMGVAVEDIAASPLTGQYGKAASFLRKANALPGEVRALKAYVDDRAKAEKWSVKPGVSSLPKYLPDFRATKRTEEKTRDGSEGMTPERRAAEIEKAQRVFGRKE